MFYLTTHSTHFIYGYMASDIWLRTILIVRKEGRKEMFYLTTHSTHFIYGYMASDIWLRTILIVRKETRCRHTGYAFRLTTRVILYAPSHRQDSTYHGLCYTSRGERERNVLFNDALNTFYLRLYGVRHMVKDHSDTPVMGERERNVLFNDTLNTFYLRLYGVRHMVKDHSDSERKPAATTWATLSD